MTSGEIAVVHARSLAPLVKARGLRDDAAGEGEVFVRHIYRDTIYSK
jgi:hypothetical protein